MPTNRGGAGPTESSSPQDWTLRAQSPAHAADARSRRRAGTSGPAAGQHERGGGGEAPGEHPHPAVEHSLVEAAARAGTRARGSHGLPRGAPAPAYEHAVLELAVLQPQGEPRSPSRDIQEE